MPRILRVDNRIGEPMSDTYQPPWSSDLPVATDECKGNPTASLVLGLISVVAWIIPLIGLPTTIAGLIAGIKGLGSQRRGTAIAGIVLSIIFLVVTLLIVVSGDYVGAKRLHSLMPYVHPYPAVRPDE